jgi:adenosylhomocysteine nucleosidase
LSYPIILLVSADYEWQSWVDLHPGCKIEKTPYGGCFEHTVDRFQILSLQGGWGKVSAAASTQWAIDHHHPDLVLNLGTCGGLEGRIERQTILLVERTVQYDIQEQMTDPEGANQFYSCDLDLTWLGNHPLPEGTIRACMFSADRDVLPSDVRYLIEKLDARAADWESGAIAWVSRRNQKPLIILRGVSDLVGPHGGESYGKVEVFHKNTRKIMETLAGQLPRWLQVYSESRRIIFPTFDVPQQ